jgi:hypothetical protein
MKQKSIKQMIWGLGLIGYGMYSFVSGMGFEEVSKLAMGVGMGQGSVFVLWGLREWIGYSIKVGWKY